IVGAPGNTVGFNFSIVFNTSAASNFGKRIILLPNIIDKFITVVIPYTWKKGRTPSIVSLFFSNLYTQDVHISTLETKLKWVSITPFGLPVVPPVYCNKAKSSSGSTSTG